MESNSENKGPIDNEEKTITEETTSQEKSDTKNENNEPKPMHNDIKETEIVSTEVEQGTIENGLPDVKEGSSDALLEEVKIPEELDDATPATFEEGRKEAGEEELNKLKEKLTSFLQWCEGNSLNISEKVSVEFQGTSHRYGMMAKVDIKRGETLFKIPRNLLLDPPHGCLTAQLREYEAWLDSLGRSMEDSSGWVPLLITLMYEFTKADSFWAPYLNLVPKISEFGHPLFWKEEDMNKELSGMSLLYDLLEDRKNIEEEYKLFVLPFIMKNKELAENIEKFDMNLFKRMIAFVMAYSFTEDQESPSMIPMADILNHHSNNNAHLMFERDCLKMVSCRKIDQGEEVFNTFGKLGNSELLQMYGYTENNNSYDTLTIYVQSFIDVIEKSGRIPSSYLQAMSALLHKSEIAMTYDFFIFDKNGMRRGPDLIQFLKIVHMSEEEFEQVLKSRAGSRPDSFCHKLLRKLKLAKKTDTSTGVAVIDITEDEAEVEPPSKRSLDCEEIEDNESGNASSPAKRQCIYEGGALPSGTGTTLSHFTSDKLSHFPHYSATTHVNGFNSEEPIVIDDESEDENEARHEGEAEKKDIPSSENTKAVVVAAVVEKDSAQKEEIDEDGNKENIVSDENNKDQIIENEAGKEQNQIQEQKEADVVASEEITTKTPNDVLESNEGELSNSEKSEDDKKDNKLQETNSAAPETLASPKEKEMIQPSPSEAELEEKKDTDTAAAAKTEQEEEDELLLESSDEADDEKIEHPDEETLPTDENEEEEEEEEEEVESDEDDIEITSEDIGCAITLEKLRETLKPEWKETIKQVLESQLSSMKPDDDIKAEQARATLSRDDYNAYNVRQGQRSLVRTYLQWLS